jgi:FixJ family two-component response regulator
MMSTSKAFDSSSAPAEGPRSTVFLIDDDPSVRKGLSRLLRIAGYEVESFASAQEFLDRPRFDGCGCLVLDIRMPGLSGLSLQEELAKADYSMPIIFITGHGDIPTSVQAMQKGAVDFLAKPFDKKDLLKAVKTAIEKDRTARPVHAERIRARECIDTLTPREREVMTRVIAGLLNKQIAGELDITEATVKVHRGRVMEKMKVISVADLVRKAASGS